MVKSGRLCTLARALHLLRGLKTSIVVWPQGSTSLLTSIFVAQDPLEFAFVKTVTRASISLPILSVMGICLLGCSSKDLTRVEFMVRGRPPPTTLCRSLLLVKYIPVFGLGVTWGPTKFSVGRKHFIILIAILQTLGPGRVNFIRVVTVLGPTLGLVKT